MPAANPAPSKREPSPFCRCATSLPKGETSWIARKTKAFLPEEGGTAQAVTEGAAHEQVRIRSNLMRILPICKTPSVFACGKSSSLKEGASPLCRCATSLPKGETRWIARKTKAFLPEEGGTAQAVTEGAARGQVCAKVRLMRQVCSAHRLLGSPFGRAGICEAND